MMAAENKTTVTACSLCHSEYRIPAAVIGKKIICKKCGRKFEAASRDENTIGLAIGKLAIHYKLISEKQLEEALSIYQSEKQRGKNSSLENIFLSKGLISSRQLKVLNAAKHFQETRPQSKQFGAIAVENGVVSQEEVDQALEKQKGAFKKNGFILLVSDVLVETGALTAEQRDQILMQQGRLEKKAPKQSNAVEEKDTPAGEKGNNQAFELTVSEDKLKAFIQATEDRPDSNAVEDIKKLLEEKGIIYGVLSDTKISEYLQFANLKKEPFMIAKGTASKTGRDAYIKYYFDRDHLKSGKVDSGGHIDFRDRGEVPHVKGGDLLAEKIPAVPGAPGTDVYGRSLSAQAISDSQLRIGSGAILSEGRLKVFAKTDGQPKASMGGKISVFSELKIEGDVSLKTGHVEFDGNIIVTGSIQKGFRVKGGSLSANEIIGGEIEVVGDMCVLGGIIGATIKAQGNISAKYIKDSKLEAFGDVIAEKEIIDSEIATSGACRVTKGKIISSSLSAKKGIEAVDIGTDVSNPCKLKAGVAEHIEKEINGIQKALSRKKEGLKQLQENLQEFEEKSLESHKKIAEQAQVQDRAIIEQRAIQEEIQGHKEKNEKDKLLEAEYLLNELDQKAKAADESLTQLFKEQDRIQDKILDTSSRIKMLMEEIEELKEERTAIIEWSKKEKGIAIVKAGNQMMAGTTIFGIHSSLILKNTFRKASVKEVKITDPDAEYEWELRVFA